MINESDYDSRWAAEWKLIYAVIVAGKSAVFADQVMTRLIDDSDPGVYPFDQLRAMILMEDLDAALLRSRTGNYRKFAKCFPELIKLDAETCSVEELEAIHGIGGKTSRFFLLWTRPNARYAALDTHVMKFLKRLGHTTSRQTPPAGTKTYKKLETIFLAIAARMNVSARELDYSVWKSYAEGAEEELFSTLAADYHLEELRHGELQIL